MTALLENIDLKYPPNMAVLWVKEGTEHKEYNIDS